MAALLSRNRPEPPIFAFTDNANTGMGLNLHWGVTPIVGNLSTDMERNVKESIRFMLAIAAVKPGDAVLVVSDLASVSPATPTFTQSIQVRTVG